MKKIEHCLYNIIFWISRIITIFLFGICLFAVLNAKYVFSESFFPNLLFYSLQISKYIHNLFNINSIVSITKTTFLTDPTLFQFKYPIYKLFCINSQNINILICALIFILLIYFITKKYILNNKKTIIFIILNIFTVYFLIYLFTKNINMLFLSLLSPVIFITIYYINLYLPIQNTIMLIPVIGEICSINNIVKYTNIIKSKKVFILIISVILTNMIYIFLPYYKQSNSKVIIKRDNDVYSLTVDPIKNRFLLSSPIAIFDMENKKIYKINNKTCQYTIVNWNKNEAYFVFKDTLYIVDINTKKEKNKIKILNDKNVKSVGIKLICDNKYEKILVVFETEYNTLLIDLTTLKILKEYEILYPNDDGVYNKFRESFMLTSFQIRDMIQEIKAEKNSINNIIVGSEQGYIAISERNKEVYIAFHQQGRIGVYDAETMELKRKIKTNYAVKDITYDEDLNVLIAPSYFNGYIDLFLMDGSDKLLIRKFVGYELRQANFDTKKENLYVCSRKGLYKVPINIKKLIKKNKNVSHETSN